MFDKEDIKSLDRFNLYCLIIGILYFGIHLVTAFAKGWLVWLM